MFSIVMSVTYLHAAAVIIMIILLFATTSFLLEMEAVHGHVDNYALGLEVTGNDLEGIDEDHLDWVGNYSLLPDPEDTGVPTYQNDKTGKLLVFDGTKIWQRVDDNLKITPNHPHDRRGKVIFIIKCSCSNRITSMIASLFYL